MVFEYATKGSLSSFLDRHSNDLSDLDKLEILDQICQGLLSLAMKGLKHGRLSPDSVLVTNDQRILLGCIDQTLLTTTEQKDDTAGLAQIMQVLAGTVL